MASEIEAQYITFQKLHIGIAFTSDQQVLKCQSCVVLKSRVDSNPELLYSSSMWAIYKNL